MTIKLGTFNLNNLFSRYNFRFRAEAGDLPEGSPEYTKIRNVVESLEDQPVAYEGVALKHKDPGDRQKIIDRIAAMDLDVLAVQEVEDIDTLRYFARHELPGNPYPHLILIEGNDPRLIDVAVLSKYPIGAVTSWQHATHPDSPSERVFSRDLVQVEIYAKNRTDRLFTLYNTHLKSHFVPFTEDPVAGEEAANKRRRQQAEMTARIIKQQMRPDSAFALLGDLNDPPNSPFLKAISQTMVDGLKNASQTTALPDTPTFPWTHRFKPSGEPAHYELFDHIWLSQSLAAKQTGAFIHRRSKLGGDGSDHDAAWVELNL